MSVRDPGSLSRANGAQLVVDHFLRGWRSMKKEKKEVPHHCTADPKAHQGGSVQGYLTYDKTHPPRILP